MEDLVLRNIARGLFVMLVFIFCIIFYIIGTELSGGIPQQWPGIATAAFRVLIGGMLVVAVIVICAVIGFISEKAYKSLKATWKH